MDRNMDNLDVISDEDLKMRLKFYGLPNIPVTASTRKVLIKKLRTSMANEKTKLRRNTTQATRYSSGEDSDYDAYNKSKFDGRTARNSTADVQQKNFKFQVPAPKSIPSPSTTAPFGSPTRRLINTSAEETMDRKARSQMYSSPMITSETEEEDDSDCNNSLSSIRNRVPVKTGSCNMSSQNSNGHNRSNDLPYLSDFTKRLLKLREKSGIPAPYRGGQVYQDREIVHHAYPPATQTQQSSMLTAYSTPRSSNKFWIKNMFVKFDQNYYNGLKQSIIPCSLVSGLIIFFIVVIFMYLTISPNILSSLNEHDTNFALCRTPSSRDCIESQAKLETTLGVLRIIVPELQRRAIEKLCGRRRDDNLQNIAMSSNEIVNWVLGHKPDEHYLQIQGVLKNIEYLVVANPQWSITNMNEKGDQQQLSESNITPLSLVILNPKLPFSCLLKNKFQNFFFVIGILSIIGVLFYVSHVAYNWYVTNKRLKRDKFNGLVNEILQTAASMSPTDQAIVLNHLRDKVLPPGKRGEMSKVWNEAIKFLELNDSRLQFDITTINGEDCKTIKWIDTISRMSPAKGGIRGGSSSTVKKWQSPAFDKSNKITDPPTPCLKIRQMFDKYEANYPNLKVVIQDSILEKVGSNCMIYDIQLDTSTCCVYVRCATSRDAGIVHDEINGWWFDKRLVSIKFVRLERYLNRFPKSLSGPACLKPSNTNKSSMSQCDATNNNNIDEQEIDDDDGNDYDDN